MSLLLVACASQVQWQYPSDPRVTGSDKLPVMVDGELDRLVRGAALPGDPVGLVVWQGADGHILRVQDGKLTEARGYGSLNLAAVDDCPVIEALARLTRPAHCVRTYLTRQQGQFMSRVRVVVHRPMPASIRLGKTVLHGVMVIESLHAPARTGNFYFFDEQGRYVVSRQWLTADDAFDVFAVEHSQ